MAVNPYESPTTPSQPQPPDNKRGYRWVGTLLMCLAIFPYIPMTVIPFFSAVASKEPLLILAGIFNGCVCATLFFGGRWLRKKGRRPPASDIVDPPG